MLTSQMLREAAVEFRADLLGIAPIERFAGVDPKHHPSSIFPQAKSVIVVGRRILRGAIRPLEEKTAVSPYLEFGLSKLEDQFLPKTAYDLVLLIEKHHFDGVPIFGYDVEAASKVYMADPVAPGKVAPNVYIDIQRAGELAGLGKVGKHGLLITPRFGTLQRLSLILTEAELEGDPLIEEDYCAGCDACRRACAFAMDRTRCGKCEDGAFPTNFGHFNTIDRLGAACSRACLVSMEKRGLLSGKFAQCFRNEER